MDEALEAAVAAAAKSAKSAKRATVLMLFAVGIAVAVLTIDNSIKRVVVDEAENARRLLDEFKQTVGKARKEALDGTEATVQAGDPGGAGLNGSSDVVHDPGAGADVDPAPVPARRAPARRKAGTGRRPPRDG